MGRPTTSALLSAIAVATVSACGTTTPHSNQTSGPASAPTSAAVPAGDVAVISGWANALRSGREQAAAAFWAYPSVMVNGTDTDGQLLVITVHNEREAILANESLPCGATYQSAIRVGPFIDALFTLGPRTGPGSDPTGCSGSARVDFLIRDAHILHWIRAPSNGATPPPPSGGSGAAV